MTLHARDVHRMACQVSETVRAYGVPLRCAMQVRSHCMSIGAASVAAAERRAVDVAR